MRILKRTAVPVVMVLVVVGVASAWSLSHIASVPALAASPASASSLLTTTVLDGPGAAKIRRGQYLARAGDCLSCHITPGGEPFAGGRPLNTPFGTIYSSNITSDPDHGIGRWTPDEFYAAMHDGIGIGNRHLYPAFPYPWFRRLSRDDDDALLSFLKTLPPSSAEPPGNSLAFPVNLRFGVAFWNTLYLHDNDGRGRPQNASEALRRGEELVRGAGHCSACHSPKNRLGADQVAHDLQGGVVDDFLAPDLSGNRRTGLGIWSAEDIAEYLKTGRNSSGAAGGPMADVITYSTSLLTDDDRHAIAIYLKSLLASPDAPVVAADDRSLKRGGAVFSDVCTACHLENGTAQPTLFPPLPGNAVVQQDDPTGVLHIILAGSRVGPSPTRPTPATMPSFAWKLTDQEVADVSTYIRNSWGNQARPVTAGEVAVLRKQLGLTHLRLTDNSGDRQ
jgi:mono/diheme cytochrome c family protein